MDNDRKSGGMPQGPWQNTIRVSLIISLLVPVILTAALRWLYANDAAVLAIGGIIPVVWVVVLYARRRRVDWLGVIAAVGFAAALAASPFAGGSTLPLMIYHPAVTGAVGAVFLVSAAVGRPMLWLFIRSYNIAGPDHIERLGNPQVKKRLSTRTAVVGLVLIAEAAAHIILAYTLPAITYLEFSGVVTVAVILVLVTVIRMAARGSR